MAFEDLVLTDIVSRNIDMTQYVVGDYNWLIGHLLFIISDKVHVNNK